MMWNKINCLGKEIVFYIGENAFMQKIKLRILKSKIET